MSNILKNLKKKKKDVKSTEIISEDNGIQPEIITVNEKLNLITKTYLDNSKLDEYYIDKVSFAVMTREVMEKLSVFELKNLNKAKILENTTDDPRGGTIENNIKCPTCNKTNDDCAGHPSFIDIGVDIIHPFYIEKLLKVLKSVCIHCNKLYLSENFLRENGILNLEGSNRLQEISELSEKVNCRNSSCGPTYKFKNPVKKSDRDYRIIQYTIKNGNSFNTGYLSVERIKKILTSISDKDAKLLGFNKTHPKDFIINFIPVIPTSARPYNYTGGEKKNNYLTTIYDDILSKKIEVSQYEDPSRKEGGYNEIANMYMYNLIKTHAEFAKSNNKNQESGKSIDDILSKGKESLIRSNMMGKRCNYGSRTVIGSNRSLNFGYVALPEDAKIITLPDKITHDNIEFYKEYSKKGGIAYLCPNRGNNTGIKLNFNIDKHTLNIGDTVHRRILPGDNVILNRQPTLHRQSILGYKAEFQDKHSAGIHLYSTKGHNADFDGDESNQYYVQDSYAQCEAAHVMNAANSIMSFTYPKPLACFVYNAVTSAFLLTKDDVVLSKKEFYEGIEEIFKYTKNDYTKKNLSTLFDRIGGEIYTGKNLFSVLFPEDFYYTRKKDGKTIVKIVNGILKFGVLNKDDTGSSVGSIIQSLWKWHGKDITSNFLSDSSFLLNWYIFKVGFTVGIKDCIPNRKEEFDAEKRKIIKQMKININNIPSITSTSTVFEKEEHENKIEKELEEARSKIYKVLIDNNHLEKNNALLTMTNSGGKGSAVNTTNIICLLGQPHVEEQRPTKSLTDNKRWISTFSVNDNSPESQGFSVNSFFDGLNPSELFAQAQEGRIGIIFTAVKTGQTGYLYRKITKAQEDLIVHYDGSVRNQSNIIFQYNYGDGIASNQTIVDKNEYGENINSFFNSDELVNKINIESDMEYTSISDVITSTIKDINSKYNFEEIDVFDGDDGDENVELFEDDDGELDIGDE